jgi:uncharacterized protein
MGRMKGTDHQGYQTLIRYIKTFDRVAVAFSGGTDSTLLLAASMEALEGRVMGISIHAPYTPRQDFEESKRIAEWLGVHHLVIDVDTPPEIKGNPENRCYLCKKNLFGKIIQAAAEEGYQTVFDGTNVDDRSDHRPGMKALEEMKVVSPLREAGLGKEMIRSMARSMGLPNWDKPANACLLTRIPHHVNFTDHDLERIDLAENFIRGLGFRSVRVRMHSRLARLELPPDELATITKPEQAGKITSYLKTLGFEFITLDLQGYRMGSFHKPITG